ncbi:MAG: NUDIX domain-containing protein [Chloroflexi bacterium]|nr:NUDIX domain-containing protein [Chloroflexota bacterium]MDA1147534.1 NUDIX domain-containing protein [Chloroflexota bacterium]
MVRKATAVVTRGDGDAHELLVFEHARTGLQLPACTVEAHESFEEAAIRELAEETGLADVTLHRELGYLDEISEAGNPFHRHLFHFEPNEVVVDRWPYPCDCGDEITLYWASFATVRLDHRQQPWLDLARAALEGGA